MTDHPRRQHDELRASLSALMDCCPVDQCNPVDCPLFALRTTDRKEREQWFEALNEADLEYLAAYHYVCQNHRIHPHSEGEKGKLTPRRSVAKPRPNGL